MRMKKLWFASFCLGAFWYICWMFPANTGQGCPTHPRQGIRNWKSPWVGPAHRLCLTGRAGCQGACGAPALCSPTPAPQQEVIYWWFGLGAACFAVWLMGEPQTKASLPDSQSWAVQSSSRLCFRKSSLSGKHQTHLGESVQHFQGTKSVCPICREPRWCGKLKARFLAPFWKHVIVFLQNNSEEGRGRGTWG